jgi:hypothetical protein
MLTQYPEANHFSHTITAKEKVERGSKAGRTLEGASVQAPVGGTDNQLRCSHFVCQKGGL